MYHIFRSLPLKHTLLLLLFISYITGRAQGQATGGIGANLILDTAKEGFTLPRIKMLVPNSPAAVQGLPEGSYIINVNTISCKNKSLEEVVGLIRGEVGTAVTLSLADNPQGKKAKNYAITRALIQMPVSNMPQPDPVTIFNVSCDNEVKQLKKQGFAIIKTFTSDCGDYFFNFDTDNAPYHVRVITMETKTAATYSKGFELSADIFDNTDERIKTPLKSIGSHEQGNTMIAEMEGIMTMKRNSIGVVQVQLHPLADVKQCAGMYVVVYK